ncbi:regulator of chromosome condensation 1/beta-lactamase-inhibitor protein II [Zychaea mexicana]|uniref:regulator of chromosome condensation 1/beta-lactamase-inhibitor protein II n=1 Tax=Zychaea mexicana TaxID=64656 RepID=UPI0022FED05C|nr:regulator of chromosome condensation 1/beta-lactamase-inhibitor protein II [Zychaea mexicana]KAI9490967.1 regulator of chromosome condensation 1/beta-lactamase-inhibitor protein II [Zychaea mexicana]
MSRMLNRRLAHSLASSFSTATKTPTLYGWGNRKALPLTACTENDVFLKPVRLDIRPEYALPQESVITHIAAGWGHSLLATDAKRVYGFGLSRCGQAGESEGGGLVFECPAADDHRDIQIRQLACGREHSHIVTTSQQQHQQGNRHGQETQLYSFGNNMYGQLGLGKSKETHPGTFVMQTRPQAVETCMMNITDIACGLDHTVFVAEDKHVYAMGWGADGQLGLAEGWTGDKNLPTQLPSLGGAPIKKIAGSTDFTLALTADGGLWTWGNSEYGQGMTGAKIDRILQPIRLEHRGIVDIAAGGPFSVVLAEDGSVHTCGYGALGLGRDTIETLSLQRIRDLPQIQKVFATTDFAAAVAASGELFTWGLNGSSGRLGLGHQEHAFQAERVDIDKEVHDMVLGTNHALAICI